LRAFLISFAAWGALAGCSLPHGEEKNFGKWPDWSLTGSDGAHISALDFAHKVVIVDFWATWCIPCRREIPGFIELQNKYKERGLVIVGLSFDRDKDIHDRWIQANHLNYRSIFAQTEEAKAEIVKFERLIGPIEGYPTTIVISRNGEIVYKHVGYGSPEEFEEIIAPLL
jgi:thiol-disulfide isomerase/thioredoxin